MENATASTSVGALVTMLSLSALTLFFFHAFDDVAAGDGSGNFPADSRHSHALYDNAADDESHSFSADSRLSRVLYEAQRDLASTATGPTAHTFLDKDDAADHNISAAAIMLGVDPAEWEEIGWHAYSHWPWRLALGHAGETNVTALTEQNRTGLNLESLLRESRRSKALKSYNRTFPITTAGAGGLANSWDDSRGLAFAIYSEILHVYANVPSSRRR